MFGYTAVTENLCALCAHTIKTHALCDQEKIFCCGGCLAVYNVLSHRGELSSYRESGVFQQALRSGLISNPELLAGLHKETSTPPKKVQFYLGDLWCPSCAEVIRLVLLQERGVLDCMVDYFTDVAFLEFDPQVIGEERLIQLIRKMGYRVNPLEEVEGKQINRALWMRFGIAAFCALNLMMFAYPIYAGYFFLEGFGYSILFGWLSLAMALPVVFYCAWPLYPRVVVSSRMGILGMEALVVISVWAAFLFSTYEVVFGTMQIYYDSMAVIVALVLFGKILESKAKVSAKESAFRLAMTLPKKGRRRLTDGTELFVPLKEVAIGDLLVALTGEKIVLDGVVLEGEALIDESLLTGEAVPIPKGVGKTLIAGSLLRRGKVLYRVTANAEESRLQQIVGGVQKELQLRKEERRLTDRITAWFVPGVVGLAFFTAFFMWQTGSQESALLRGLSIMLIACPCAIGVAAPLAESYLMQKLAELGIIVRHRRCLDYLGKETRFVFDKTGTITRGSFRLLSGMETLSAQKRSILKGLTRCSVHPIAEALASAISDEPTPLNAVEEVIGRGLRGELNGESYYLGSSAFMREHQLATPLIDDQKGSLISHVYFATGKQILAVLALGDLVRSGAQECIAQLLPSPSALVSGDGEEPVAQVARQCGFSQWKSMCYPLEKRRYVEGLSEQGEIVAMVGDGVNDALALTAAHVGISVSSATDLSIQASDLLLTRSDLLLIPKIRLLACRGRRILKQNLFWAFFYNGVGLLLALTGMLTPIFAAFAMMASSLMVLYNAKRI